MSEPVDRPPARALVPRESSRTTPRPSVVEAHPAETIRLTVPPNAAAHFWDYWQIVTQHRWIVLAAIVVAGVFGMVSTFTTRPMFTAGVTLRIEKEEPRVLKFEEVTHVDSQEDYYQTQYKMLQSRTLANRVIARLQLNRHPQFQSDPAPAPTSHWSDWVGNLRRGIRERLQVWLAVPPTPTATPSAGLAVASPLTNAFLAALTIDPIRNSRLVKVSFESPYPDLAARVPNAIAEAFIAQNLEQKIEATRYATEFLTRQLEDARAKLQEAEARLSAYLQENKILFVSAGRSGDGERQDLATQQLVVLSDALMKARTERIAKESVAASAITRPPEANPTVLQSPVIARLRQELASLEAEYQKLGRTFKPEYPKMQRLEQGIAEIRRQIDTEGARVIESLQTDYRTALQSERELESQVMSRYAEASQVGDKMARYGILRRDVDTNRELYVALLTRLKETQIASALVTSNISIVDRAEIPLAPSGPRKLRTMLMFMAVGLFGGIGLAFVREYLDTTVKDTREIEATLAVPALGVVPARMSLEGGRIWRGGDRTDARLGPFALVSQDAEMSGLAEVFRALGTSLLYSTPDGPPRTMMITSLDSGDGKTSIATNLAITLAGLGRGDVLLIDADMRRSHVHELFDLAEAPGLSTVLSRPMDPIAAVKRTAVPNLSIVPAGQSPRNPAELLASARFSEVLRALGENFAHIVLDCPPIFGVSDALILAPRVEGVILLLRHQRASRDGALRAIELLDSVRAHLLGVVLNDVNIRKDRASYGRYYSYYPRDRGNRGREA